MLLKKLSAIKTPYSSRKPISRFATFATLLCSLYAHQTSAQVSNLTGSTAHLGTLGTVNVLATRSEKTNLETPATISTINKDEMDRRGVKKYQRFIF